MELIDAHLGEDAPAVGKLAQVAVALVVWLELRLLALLILLQLLCLLLESAGIPRLLGAWAHQSSAGLLLLLLLGLEDVVVVALEGGVLVFDRSLVDLVDGNGRVSSRWLQRHIRARGKGGI